MQRCCRLHLCFLNKSLAGGRVLPMNAPSLDFLQPYCCQSIPVGPSVVKWWSRGYVALKLSVYEPMIGMRWGVPVRAPI